MRIICAIVLAALCAGCVTVEPPHTASGRPEVTIAGASPDKVKPQLVNVMINDGYRITRDTPYEITFDKPVQNIAVAVLMGSKYDAQPNIRVSYSFAQLGSDTRVIGDIAIVTNPGSAFERRTPINAGVDSSDIQILLDEVRGKLDPTSPLGIAKRNNIVLGIGVMTAARAHIAGMQGPDRGLYVVAVASGSVAERAGITKGDVIFAYAGRPVNEQRELADAQAATKSGSTVKITMYQGGQERDISVTFPAVSKAGKSKERVAHSGQTAAIPHQRQ